MLQSQKHPVDIIPARITAEGSTEESFTTVARSSKAGTPRIVEQPRHSYLPQSRSTDPVSRFLWMRQIPPSGDRCLPPVESRLSRTAVASTLPRLPSYPDVRALSPNSTRPCRTRRLAPDWRSVLELGGVPNLTFNQIPRLLPRLCKL